MGYCDGGGSGIKRRRADGGGGWTRTPASPIPESYEREGLVTGDGGWVAWRSPQAGGQEVEPREGEKDGGHGNKAEQRREGGRRDGAAGILMLGVCSVQIKIEWQPSDRGDGRRRWSAEGRDCRLTARRKNLEREKEKRGRRRELIATWWCQLEELSTEGEEMEDGAPPAFLFFRVRDHLRGIE